MSLFIKAKKPIRMLRKLFAEPVITSVYTTEKVVALTFDDGPVQPFTATVLDILKEYHIKATFFLLGQNCLREPKLVQRIVREGHSIGNHTHTHQDLGVSDQAACIKDISDAEQILDQMTNTSTTFFRPPYGRYQRFLFPILKKMKYQIILWSIDPVQWDDPVPTINVKQVVDTAQPGSIILLHDGVEEKPTATFDRNNTIESLPLIIEGLQQKGFRFVTIPELLALEQ